MRMNKLEFALAEEIVKSTIRFGIVPGTNRAVERRNQRVADLLPVEFFSQRAVVPANDVWLVTVAVETLEDIEHDALYAAQNRQHLDVTDRNGLVLRSGSL